MIGVSPSGQNEDYYMEKSLKAKRSTIKSPERSTHIEDLFSLRDMIDNIDWKEDEEKFFEIIIPQNPKEEKEDEDEGLTDNP
jgi:hypothetical protein